MTYKTLCDRLNGIYDAGEAKAVVRHLLETAFHLSYTDIVMGAAEQIPERDLLPYMCRLAKGEPVQYVLGQADFGNITLHVEPGVLIPRPETFELCQWLTDTVGVHQKANILDIGTGSGCIAIALAKMCPHYTITATDISDKALRIARDNVTDAGVEIRIVKADALCMPDSLSGFDAIISNPPYICNKERSLMETNVLEWEPATALFVPDDNPLLFYRAITEYAGRDLNAGGWLFFEINPIYVDDMVSLFQCQHWQDIDICADMFGRQRFIKARKP